MKLIVAVVRNAGKRASDGTSAKCRMVGSSRHQGQNLDGDFVGENLGRLLGNYSRSSTFASASFGSPLDGNHDSLACRVLKNLATLGVSVFASKRGSQPC